jgi:hypothetical protein
MYKRRLIYSSSVICVLPQSRSVYLVSVVRSFEVILWCIAVSQHGRVQGLHGYADLHVDGHVYLSTYPSTSVWMFYLCVRLYILNYKRTWLAKC